MLYTGCFYSTVVIKVVPKVIVQVRRFWLKLDPNISLEKLKTGKYSWRPLCLHRELRGFVINSENGEDQSQQEYVLGRLFPSCTPVASWWINSLVWTLKSLGDTSFKSEFGETKFIEWNMASIKCPSAVRFFLDFSIVSHVVYNQSLFQVHVLL